MIVYGWNSKNIKQAPLDGYECSNCQEKKSHLAIFAHYAHIFWIPLLPYKKSAQIVCQHCQLATEEKQMPDNMKAKIGELKSSVGIPKYLFSGLGILLLAVAYLVFTAQQNEKLEEEYMADPQRGDVYVLKNLEETSTYRYYLIKVDDIVGDSLTVLLNTYNYDGIVDQLDPEDGFLDVRYSMHKQAVIDYNTSGELIKVIRDYSDHSGFNRMIDHQVFDSTAVN